MKTSNRQSDKMQALLPAWRGLRRVVPYLGAIHNEREYARMNALMDNLLKEVGDDEEHDLAGFLDIVSTLVADYEDKQHPSPAPVEPREVLRLLMDQHALKQVDLVGEFGSQGIVSEILSGKREINARQAKSLAKRFGVSPAVFI